MLQLPVGVFYVGAGGQNSMDNPNFGNIEDWQQRLIEERDQLSERIGKLTVFMSSQAYRDIDQRDQFLLSQQFLAMSKYRAILNDRIDRIMTTR